MPRFATKLIERHEVAEGTMAFVLERPAGFDFTAGQYLTITLPDPPYNDAKGNSRTFSIASAPQETGHLLIATRMTGSALKRSLAEVPLGTPVEHLRPGRRIHLAARCHPSAGVHRRRHRHHAVSQHGARRRKSAAPAPDHADLLQPHARRRTVS